MPSSLFGSGFPRPLALVSFILAGVAIAAADSAPTGETIKLPDLAVTGRQELPPPESWQYARLDDGTEVLSNASERASRRMLRDFQMFQQALGIAWPALAGPTQPIARMLILCGARNKFDDFATRTGSGTDLGSTSRFFRSREQAAIIVDLQANTLNLGGLDDDVTGNVTSFEVDPNRQLYREYVRFLLSQGGTRPPPWLQEGMAQIVMAMEFTPDWIKLGGLDSGASAPAAAPNVAANPEAEEGGGEAAPAETLVGDRPFNAVLRRRSLLPMETLFTLPPDAPEAVNPLGNNRWAKQAYAFVHLCLYGENGRYKAAFDEFTRRLQTQPVSEALFKDCFKMSYRDMLFALRGYIDFTNHRTDTFKLNPGSPKFGGEPVVLRAATQSEIGRIKGDAQHLAGRIHDALASYSDAYLRGEREPILLAGYGIAASETGQPERALPLLEAAASGPGTRRPSVYVELARQRLMAATAKAGPNGRLTEAQMTTIMEPLLKARSIRLPLPAIYTTMAEAWLISAAAPKPDHFALLGEGIRLFPRESLLFYSLAQLYKQNGDPVSAGKVAEVGLKLAPDDASRARLQQLLASLPATPAAPAKQ